MNNGTNGNGNGNGKFRENEVVRIHGKDFPIISGRLRLALEACENVSIDSEILRYEPGTLALARVAVKTTKGSSVAHGLATVERDSDLVEALVELSETRALARALRWLGYGLEVGFEEIEHATDLPTKVCQDTGTFGKRTGNGVGNNGSRVPVAVLATSAQTRCIETLARQLKLDPEIVIEEIIPEAVEGLTVAQASRIIDDLKKRMGTNGKGMRG